MASKSASNTPRTASTASHFDDSKADPRQDSVRSSRLGSFNEEEPTFDSQGSSETESEVVAVEPTRPSVSVVWQKLTVVSRLACGSLTSKLKNPPATVPVADAEKSTFKEAKGGVFGGQRRRLLNGVSGFAQPRTVLAVVGPPKSGKSALVDAIGDRRRGYSSVTGSLTVNGRSLKDSGVLPTFFCTTDEPLANVTVEQALVYSALLQMPDSREFEAEIKTICERLGLLNELTRPTNSLDPGTKRRLTVACQMVRCTSLLVMHDTLLGIQEGDALAILRAVHDLTRGGCTAIVVCQQPTTDICSFFTNAYILTNGELIYFGDSFTQAFNLLSSAGLPCPPLYSPVEQYMRLLDPSFEVYMQAPGAAPGGIVDTTSRFSTLMFKVLQNAYLESPLATQTEQTASTLAYANYDAIDDRKARLAAPRQWFVLCRRLVTQGLQGLPLYLGRIIFTVIICLVYGGSYWKLNSSFLAAEERTTILFIVAAVIPALAIGTLSFYTNGTQVLLREHKRCQLGLLTHFAALFTLTLPHLGVAAVLATVILIPMVSLNSSGLGWGYLIVNGTMVQMCADSMVLFVATVVPVFLQYPVALGLFLIQALASGFFPGANRGFNLPVNVVSFTSWSYKGLLQNEFIYRTSESYGCPGAGRVEALSQGSCSLTSRDTYDVLANSQAVLTDSRWNAIYILIGIYAFWSLAYMIALIIRSRGANYRLSGELQRNSLPEPTVVINNPLHSSRGHSGEALNGFGQQQRAAPV